MQESGTMAAIAEAVPTASSFRRRSATRLGIGVNVRRIAILLLSLACRTWVPFFLLGLFGRCTRRFGSVFFCYAGNEHYARHYGYSFSKVVVQWFPSPIGFFKQGGEWGIICACHVTEREFMNPSNAANLNLLIGRLERIRKLTGARQLSLAGVLPSFLSRSSEFSNTTCCTDHTPQAVCLAIHSVRQRHFDGSPHRVVLLGGAGRIGKDVCQRLANEGIEAVVLDIVAGTNNDLPLDDKTTWPILFVDMSRRDVIERYVPFLPSGSVVLNEVFPEPSRKVLDLIKAQNVSVIHISGVKAEVFPSLPFGYGGALPCCAIHSPNSTELVLTPLS